MNAINVLESAPAATRPAAVKPASKPRPLGKQLMHLVRRTHLYVGLLLFPWAVLYGVTGFLFNHPTFFADDALRP